MPNARWMVIVNPIAGAGISSEVWPHISAKLKAANIAFDCQFTSHKFHAVNLTIDSIKKEYRNFIVVGGDGTIHEVINGFFYQKEVATEELTLAIIPIGNGNDFIRMYDIPTDYEKAIRVIKEGRAILTDVARVSFMDLGVQRTTYMANSSGLGLDAKVIRKYESLMEFSGHRKNITYANVLFRTFLLYRACQCHITVDGKDFFKGALLTGNISLGRYIGGGMMAIPSAIPDDGLLEVMTIESMSKVKIATRIIDFIKGTLYHIKGVQHTRGRHIEVHCNTTNFSRLEVDGEPLGTPPFIFDILPESLCLIVGPYFAPSPKDGDEPEL